MELREQRFGIEIEMTGITRAGAAKVAATYFGTRSEYVGTYYQTYAAVDQEGRQWKFMSDGSIRAEKKVNGEKRAAGAVYRTEIYIFFLLIFPKTIPKHYFLFQLKPVCIKHWTGCFFRHLIWLFKVNPPL